MRTSASSRTLLLQRQHLQRRQTNGEFFLVYIGSEAPIANWRTHLEGYEAGVVWVVNPSDVELPERLERCAAPAGMKLKDHPFIPRFRREVAEVLLAEGRVKAPEVLGQLTGQVWNWSSVDLSSAEQELERARRSLEATYVELVHDLAARAQRRAASEWMRPPMVTVKLEDDVTPLLLRSLQESINEARRQALPQRLPHRARRPLERLPAGVYLAEDGLVRPAAGLDDALRQASNKEGRSELRAVIDWDGRHAVLVRTYDVQGEVKYRLEDALRRRGQAADVRLTQEG